MGGVAEQSPPRRRRHPRDRRGAARVAALLAVDNTFATPLGQRPLALGADLVVHSATKFLSGHSDLLSGVAVAKDAELEGRLRHVRELAGATPGALESFLALRGVRTLSVRLERAARTAGILAERLVRHERVERVRYPGLPADPSHAVAKSQLATFGAMLSFDVRGGALAADAVCASVRLIQHATSPRRSRVEPRTPCGPRGQEHLPPGLIRLSVGLKSLEDLWRDLGQALATTNS
ncbi:MAG: PLP-dependent transferase [Planctomycetota bacterium]